MATPEELPKHPETPMPTAEATTVNDWPGAFGIFKSSRKAVGLNLWTIVAIYALIVVASFVISAVTGTSDLSKGINIGREVVAQVLSLIVGSFFGIAMTDLLLTSVAGKRMEFKESFRKVSELFIPYVLLSILTALVVFASIIAFIIPFFFVLPRIMLAPYFLVDRGLSAVDALKASWDETKGHSGKIWGVIGATLVMILPVFTIIGIPVAIYLLVAYAASSAILYRFISKQPFVKV